MRHSNTLYCMRAWNLFPVSTAIEDGGKDQIPHDFAVLSRRCDLRRRKADGRCVRKYNLCPPSCNLALKLDGCRGSILQQVRVLRDEAGGMVGAVQGLLLVPGRTCVTKIYATEEKKMVQVEEHKV